MSPFGLDAVFGHRDSSPTVEPPERQPADVEVGFREMADGRAVEGQAVGRDDIVLADRQGSLRADRHLGLRDRAGYAIWGDRVDPTHTAVPEAFLPDEVPGLAALVEVCDVAGCGRIDPASLRPEDDLGGVDGARNLVRGNGRGCDQHDDDRHCKRDRESARYEHESRQHDECEDHHHVDGREAVHASDDQQIEGVGKRSRYHQRVPRHQQDERRNSEGDEWAGDTSTRRAARDPKCESEKEEWWQRRQIATQEVRRVTRCEKAHL